MSSYSAFMAGLINTQVTPVRNYDVFLNHRGPDVKRGFVDHLSAALETAGVHSFVDYRELHRGENNWDAIESAIGHSKVHIAIFSGGYADSSWCLRELHAMLQCRANGSSDLFLPVFYNVTPSDLRHSSSPSSCYSSAFEKLLPSNYKPEDVQNWKNALYQASNITGHTLANEHGARGFEASLVKRIVSDVLNVLDLTLLDVAKHAVGVDEKLKEALHLMEIDKVQKGFLTLGIFGMGGMGKTTLAKSIYNSIYRKFDCCSFMECVSEAKTTNDLRGVEERMLRALLKDESISITDSACGKKNIKARLRERKILIILDDVDDPKQLEKLWLPIESYHPKDGSLLVITTRDEQMVTTAQKRLHVQGLSDQNAHLLFNWHAFLRRDAPSNNFERLAKKVVDACDGLPLALVTMGSHLYNKDVAFWRGTVKALESDRRNLLPAQKKVTSILRTSYDGLGSEEKSMFLDIACFLNGEQKARAMRIWGESNAAELCLETLKLKSLVKLDQDGRLTMHDMLRDMGREIVEGSHKNIWQRSHLWNKGDVHLVLRNKKGTSEVRGVCLAMEGEEKWGTQAFAGMDLLQILVLSKGIITGDFSCLSKELRWFQWRGCPLASFTCGLALNNVIVLDLEGSKISSLSAPGRHMLMNLKELSLKHCSKLKHLPEFNDCCKKLEVLDLSHCHNLETLPRGLGNLHSLKSLLLNWCTLLTRLPESIGQLTALEEIGLKCSQSLTLLPQTLGNLTNLSSLNLERCSSLKELPSTIGKSTNLSSLNLHGCGSLKGLPSTVGNLTNLVHLHANDAKKLSNKSSPPPCQ